MNRGMRPELSLVNMEETGDLKNRFSLVALAYFVEFGVKKKKIPKKLAFLRF